MIKVVTAGVMDHKLHITPSEGIMKNLMSKAAPTDRHNTRTEKITVLLVSVSLVNIAQNPFPRRRTGEAFLPSSGRWAVGWRSQI
jgi:hypothetical protein